MAKANGRPGWALDDQESKSEKEKGEVEDQARQFCEQNMDILTPVLARVEHYKGQADADSPLMLTAFLKSSVNGTMQVPVVVATTASQETKN